MKLNYAIHANRLSLVAEHAIALLRALNACLASICCHLDYANAPLATWYRESASLLLAVQVQSSMQEQLIA